MCGDQVGAADHQRPLPPRRPAPPAPRGVGDDADLGGAGLAPLPGERRPSAQVAAAGVAGDHDGKGHRGTAW